MRIVAHSKYDVGDHVDFTHSYPKTVNDTGVIRQVRFMKSHHQRPECTSITYIIEPDDMIGFEHDDDHLVGETSILGRIPA